MDTGWLLWLILLFPVAGALFIPFLRSGRGIFTSLFTCILVDSVFCIIVAQRTFHLGPQIAMEGWLYLDALSAYHLLVMLLVFIMASYYGKSYFAEEVRSGHFPLAAVRRYGTLWMASLAAMTLVLVSNNLGIMWVGMETTTLVTAFLISVHSRQEAVEAMWKYLIVCSVGIAFAFLGILLVAAATTRFPEKAMETLLWTDLRTASALLDPTLMKAAFLFILVGFGTKAGLAPMHTWLPDAHSQAPAPVSAIFSGFMLNASLFCIMRHKTLVDTVLGSSDFTNDLMLLFGGASIIIAAAFILRQNDLKRLLAYSTVEHLGIITIGLGLGRLGIFAALLHTLSHSVCKSLGFFSAGSLGKTYGTYDMRKMSGAVHLNPTWGKGLMGSLMALIGVAPFPIFISELLIVKSAIQNGATVTVTVFLLGSIVVFVGVLQHVIPVLWGTQDKNLSISASKKPFEHLLLMTLFALLLGLGLWIPDGLNEILNQAAGIVGGAIG